MEWVATDLRRTNLENFEILDVFRDVSSGLAFIHEHRYTHRDIKQGNILIGHSAKHQRRVAKITDFGLTKHNGDQLMRTNAGTPAYQAPEMFQLPDVTYSSAIDIWALGLLILELLLGKEVSDLLEEVGLLYASFEELAFHLWFELTVLPRIEKLPPEFRPLVLETLAIDPSRRWTAAKCVAWLDAQPDLVPCLADFKAQLGEDTEAVVPAMYENSCWKTNVVDLSEARRINMAAEVEAAKSHQSGDQGADRAQKSSTKRSSAKRTLALTSLASTQGTSVLPPSRKKGKHLLTI